MGSALSVLVFVILGPGVPSEIADGPPGALLLRAAPKEPGGTLWPAGSIDPHHHLVLGRHLKVRTDCIPTAPPFPNRLHWRRGFSIREIVRRDRKPALLSLPPARAPPVLFE
jgi:hypothetical protein